MVNKRVFTKNKFNSHYQIIGDFDFFLKMSKKYKFCCLQRSLANYRQHKENFSSKKSNIYVIELSKWLKNNANSHFKSYNLFKIKRYYVILKIKNLIKKIVNLF